MSPTHFCLYDVTLKSDHGYQRADNHNPASSKTVMWFEAPPPNYGTRGFHKSGYQEPEPVRDVLPERNHRHVSKFVGVGVERGTQAYHGFAYGSEAEYQSSRTNYRRPRETLNDRM